jgi:hypothetical protein
MYERAIAEINRGLSLGARLLLGCMTSLFGFLMFLTAEEPDAIYSRAFGVFCLLIALACCTAGRVRQFVGSSVGAGGFLLGMAYLAAMLSGGELLPEDKASPSVFNALSYLLFIGIPGVVYACRARFGLGKPPPSA